MQSYTAEGFDQFNNDLGDVTGSSTFTIAPDGSCADAVCTATVAGDQAECRFAHGRLLPRCLASEDSN
jgi:hypothetical protein